MRKFLLASGSQTRWGSGGEGSSGDGDTGCHSWEAGRSRLREWRPGVLLSVLPCPGQLPPLPALLSWTLKNYPAPNASAEAEKPCSRVNTEGGLQVGGAVHVQR